MSAEEVTTGNHHTLIFDRIRTNVGLGYNSFTGVFTAPKEGIYVFTWVIRMHQAEHSTELMINNDSLGTTFLRAKNNDDGSVSGTAVAHVLKGDVVFVRILSHNAGDLHIRGRDMSSYIGIPRKKAGNQMTPENNFDDYVTWVDGMETISFVDKSDMFICCILQNIHKRLIMVIILCMSYSDSVHKLNELYKNCMSSDLPPSTASFQNQLSTQIIIC